MYIKTYPRNQYGFGSWLKKNASWLAPVGAIGATILTGGLAAPAAGAALAGGAGAATAGAGAAAAVGGATAATAAGSGLASTIGTLGGAAALGSAVGNPISQSANMDEAQAAQEKQRQEMIRQQEINNQLGQLQPQQQYASTFANGGIISSYQGEFPNVSVDNNGGTTGQKSYTKEELDAKGIQGYTLNGALAEYKRRHGLQGVTYNPKDSTVSSNIDDKGGIMTVQSSPEIWGKMLEGILRGEVNGYGTPPDPAITKKLTKHEPAIDHSKNKFVGGAKANGGGINQSSGLPNVTMYNNGGTHQSNPMGGIPLGNSGNSVEQNEVRFGDYIFSDRLPYKKLSKKRK